MADDRGELRKLASLGDVVEEGEENNPRNRLVSQQENLVDHG